jgi:hypothetical protein
LTATPPKHAPTAMSAIKIVAVVLIAFTITMIVFYYVGFFDEFQASPQQQNSYEQTTPDSTSLTPARSLEGTWRTTFAVKFYIKTDFETFGELQDVGSEDRTMTWVITATSDENVVDVEVSFTSSNTQLVSGSGYTPDVSPMFLSGTISSSRLTLTSSDSRVIGEFSFTTDIMTGTWNDHWSMAYEQQVYTTTNSLVLMKQ